ncbi:hypothetical protein Droror1_Dr00026883 [Drosera rotundifolia]
MAAAVVFVNLHAESGLKSLDAYISGDEFTKDDIKVYAVVIGKPGDEFPNAGKWYELVLRITLRDNDGNYVRFIGDWGDEDLGSLFGLLGQSKAGCLYSLTLDMDDGAPAQELPEVYLGDPPHNLIESGFENLACKTEGFSCSDIAICFTSHICEYSTKNGPFNGYLDFSQGSALLGFLLGYQAQGKVLQDHPPIKMLISIAGSKFRKPSIADVAYKETIKDFATAFENPFLIRHPQGHTVPRLDEAAVEQLKNVVKALVEPSKTFMEDEDAKESNEAHLGKEDKPQDVLGNGKQEEAALDIKIENREVEAVQG